MEKREQTSLRHSTPTLIKTKNLAPSWSTEGSFLRIFRISNTTETPNLPQSQAFCTEAMQKRNIQSQIIRCLINTDLQTPLNWQWSTSCLMKKRPSNLCFMRLILMRMREQFTPQFQQKMIYKSSVLLQKGTKHTKTYGKLLYTREYLPTRPCGSTSEPINLFKHLKIFI